MGCNFPVNRALAMRPVPILQSLRVIPHALFSLFFPDSCRLCNRSLIEITRYPVCDACIGAIQPLAAEYFCSVCRTPFVSEASLDETGRCPQCLEGTRGFDAAYCFGAYDGDLRDLIHLFKYARMRSLEKPLGRYLSAALPREEQFDLIVPVPMHWRKRWTRGFNQSERLARTVCRRSGVPLWQGLRRTRKTPAQAGLTLAERRVSMETVFQIKTASARAEVRGRRVLLVDDVFTTGATASACARALKEAGAVSVILLTLARVDRRWAETAAAGSTSGAL
jgi:ComF family protein